MVQLQILFLDSLGDYWAANLFMAKFIEQKDVSDRLRICQAVKDVSDRLRICQAVSKGHLWNPST
ncbi:hypothetical protein EJ110_NYTH36714 [Nymphaea thermarum]|nr:hypothetical protein EJ110_NYTH36714 [Nymphaea thermarum]